MKRTLLLLSALRTLLVPHSCYPLFVCCLAAWLSFPLSVLAQGPLTPPGTPAPTMKSLDQIEARTPISSAPFTISQSGSYYLTKNLTVSSGDGIDINISNVTVDLNGFTISSSAASANGTGILISGGLTNITIRNGIIKGTVTYNNGNYSGGGFLNGIEYSTNSGPINTHVSGVTVSGCLSNGIDVNSGDGSAVEFCTVDSVGFTGIVAETVSNSSAIRCGGGAIAATTASNSFGYGTGSGGVAATVAINCYGVSTGPNPIGVANGLSAVTAVGCGGQSENGNGVNGYIAQACYGHSDTQIGVNASFAAHDCYGESSGSSTGLSADSASNCRAFSPSGTAISARLAQSCYGNSTNGTGISTSAQGSVIDSIGTASSGSGIVASAGTAVVSCSVFGSTTGISVSSDCLIKDNELSGNTTGVVVSGTGNRIDGNRVTSPNGQAFVVNGSNNLIIRNSARNNGTNQYVLNAAGNIYGGIYNVSAGGQLGSTTGGSEPWANFVY